jgi:hypothetical protein
VKIAGVVPILPSATVTSEMLNAGWSLSTMVPWPATSPGAAPDSPDNPTVKTSLASAKASPSTGTFTVTDVDPAGMVTPVETAV